MLRAIFVEHLKLRKKGTFDNLNKFHSTNEGRLKILEGIIWTLKQLWDYIL